MVSRWRFSVTSLALLATLLISRATTAEQCLSPSVTHSFHSSSEASTATSTVFIVNFDVTCKNEAAEKPNLYAVLANGEGVAVSGVKSAAKINGAGYQASFSGEHAELPKGAYSVRLYDEDGFAALKKAQRQEGGAAAEDAAAVEPLTQWTIQHSGVWKGEVVRGETVALVVALLVFYLAHSAKSRLHEE